MCGIFGSNNIETFRKLYTVNTDRGNFVRSITKVSTGDNKKKQITVTRDTNINIDLEAEDYCIYYLGHLQSPTTSIREFDESTSHPFIYNKQYLAHNGVLSNDRELITEYNLQGTNNVDSSIFLPLIDAIGFETALSKIKGTFGCWYYDSVNAALRIFRSGSTLFLKNGSFSSAPFEDYTLVRDGDILEYNFTNQYFVHYNKFEVGETPFFV